MTPRLVGVQFISNLLPGRVIDASTSRLLPSSSEIARRIQAEPDSDGAVWNRRSNSGTWEATAYNDEAPRQFASSPSLIDPTAGQFVPSGVDAAGQYEFYARMLAAPYYPSLNVYA